MRQHYQNAASIFRELIDHYIRRGWIWAAVLIAVLSFSLFFKIGLNASDSIPDKHVVIALKWIKDLHVNDYVVFAWEGGAPYPNGIEFIKIVKGVQGDVVEHRGRDVYINGQYMATAKEFSKTGMPLQIGFAGVIPPGKVFVYAPSIHSLDSRYALMGLVDVSTVIGRAYPLF